MLRTVVTVEEGLRERLFFLMLIDCRERNRRSGRTVGPQAAHLINCHIFYYKHVLEKCAFFIHRDLI